MPDVFQLARIQLWGGLPTASPLCCGVVSRPPHLSDKEVCDVQISAIDGRMGGSGDRPQLEALVRTGRRIR